jgi:acetolactate synthase I/II/III large subunit
MQPKSNASEQATAQPRLAGHVLVDQLICQGVTHAFGVPGESYLAVLDGFFQRQDQLQFIVCRHEGGAAVMAEAQAKLTGQTGVCFVTRGPGATNASIGVHTAFQDSTPMILFIGQVVSDFADREAFQEIDYRRMFGQMAKWVAQIDRADRLPEYIARAFAVAQSGRPGPVVLALPEDMLTTMVTVDDAPKATPVQAAPSQEQMASLVQLLEGAKQPLVLLGGFGWDAAACTDLTQFAQNNQLPVACAFRFQDLFDNRHAHYVGDVGIAINPQLAQRVRDADVLLALGPRLGEMTTSGYSLIESPTPRQQLIHVHSGAEELGQVYHGALMINAGPKQMARALAAVKVKNPLWGQLTKQARQQYEQWQQQPEFLQRGQHGFNPWQVIQLCQQMLPADTIVTNGAGNFATWAHRFWRYAGLRTQLAPTSGAMGYGVPAGIAASLLQPHRTVLTVAGDGDFQMTLQELATARQYGSAPIILIFNNGIYGTIRMHQQKIYPGRPSGTDMFNPDFVALARAYGAFAAKVDRTEQFAAALGGAIDATTTQRVPALIECQMEPTMLTTRG